MENFNAKEYRDNLAKDLKEIRKTDPEKAQKVLSEAQQTNEYQEAHAIQRGFLNPSYSIFEQNLKGNELNSAFETVHNEVNIYLNRIETTDFDESKKKELKEHVSRLLKDMKYMESLVPINESYRSGSYQVTLDNLRAMAILESMGVDVSSVINSGNSIYHYEFDKDLNLDTDILTLGKMRSKFWRQAIDLGRKEVYKEDTLLDDRMQNFVENKEHLDKSSMENKLLSEITKPLEEINFKYLDSLFDGDLSIDWVNQVGENRHVSKEVLTKLKIELEKRFLENQLMGHDDLTKIEDRPLNNNKTKENKENQQMPIIGSEIYIPREESFDHPLDDIDGGIATIKTVDGPKDGLVHKQDYIIEVNEIPGRKFSWKRLLELQDTLSKEFAGKIAKPNPDTNVYPEENDWKGGSPEDFQKWINNQ